MAGKDEGQGGTAGNGTRNGDGDADNSDSPFYVGTYKNREEAERGFQEKEAYIAKLRSEHDKAQARLDAMQNEVLGKLTSAVTTGAKSAGDDAGAKAQKAKEIEKLKEDLRADPANAVELFNAWLVESEGLLTKKMQDQVETLTKQIEVISGRLTTASPEYQQNKEIVESLTKKGVPLQQAIEIAKEFAPMMAGGGRSDKASPPGNTGGAGAAGGDGDTPRGMQAEALDMLSRLVPGGLSDNERKRLARRA